MSTGPMDVKVSFRVKESTLQFGGVNGSVACVDSGVLQSGATVMEGAQYTFKAIPDAGYHFKEWRLFANETEYPAGDVDNSGFHTYTLTMGDVSTNLIAIFERDGYVLTLSDHLRASYYWDDDGNSNTPEVIKYVSSDAQIPGDTQVTVQPAAGYQIASQTTGNPAATVYLWSSSPEQNGTVSADGQSYDFPIREATQISADTVLKHFNVSVSENWAGSGTNPGGDTVTATVNGGEHPA